MPHENNYYRRMLNPAGERFGTTGETDDVRNVVREGCARSIRLGMESP
jgi:hypothetical protein